MSERGQDINAFLTTAGWDDATRTPVPGDASTRRYERLTRGTEKAVLMDAPKAAEAAGEPEGASVAERRAIGYNALARLAGPNMESFAAIATALSQRGFSAPKILAADLDKGFILLEDFGTDVYAKVMTHNSGQEPPLYAAAVDTLAAIYRSTFSEVLTYQNVSWRVRDYDGAAMLAESDLALNWFAKDFNREFSASVYSEWAQIWQEIYTRFDAHAPGLALRDFHAENLFWLPERQATSRVGLIDFQDALFAHPTYDLVSMIEDARRDVASDLVEGLLVRFCEKSGLDYNEDFRTAYAAMGAQRNTKLLGFPVRADLMYGKPQYRALLPRIQRHLNNNLSHPALKNLRAWYAAHLPEALV